MTQTTSTVPRSAMTSECRANNHQACEVWGKRCLCPCHGPGGQQPRNARAARPQNIKPITTLPAEPAEPAERTFELEWGAPPAPRRRPPLQIPDATLAALKAKPGQWAKVRTYKSDNGAGTAAKILRDRYGDGWENTSRRLPDGGGSGLWMRWAGPGEDS